MEHATIAETTDYDRFGYKHFDEQPLSLEEAVKKAQDLRSRDQHNVYRVMPLDEEMMQFCVEKVGKSELYADLLSRFVKAWTDFIVRSSRRLR
jgi:shikimate 5-dehydrogenase